MKEEGVYIHGKKVRDLTEEEKQFIDEFNYKDKIKDLQQRIDKAIELIEKLRMEKWSIMGTDIMDLLSILKGDE